MRGFEIDTLADPQGGKYAYSAGLKLTGSNNTLISPDLLLPGIKVLPNPACAGGKPHSPMFRHA